MARHWSPLAVVYLVIALVGLVTTATANVSTVVQGRSYLGDIAAGGPAVASITWDLGLLALAAVVLLVVEGRRLGMRHLWVYVALSAVTAVAFTFPLFLANRQRMLTARREPDVGSDRGSWGDARTDD